MIDFQRNNRYNHLELKAEQHHGLFKETQTMTGRERSAIDSRSVELDGIRYVILRESVFQWLCGEAGVQRRRAPAGEDLLAPGFDLDRASLAERLVRRRQAARLSQAELARRAGIRPETLNRIERGRSTPDFRTVRKLVVAMNAAEGRQLAGENSEPSHKESTHADQP